MQKTYHIIQNNRNISRF